MGILAERIEPKFYVLKSDGIQNTELIFSDEKIVSDWFEADRIIGYYKSRLQ